MKMSSHGYPTPLVRHDLAKLLLSDPETRRAGLSSLKMYADSLPPPSLPRFLSQISEAARDCQPYAIRLYQEIARIHGKNLIPHIPHLMDALTRALLDSGSSPHLQQESAKVVVAIAKSCIDPSSTLPDIDLILHHLCDPLLHILHSKLEPLSTGAATCLRALVECENWKFAPSSLISNLCLKANISMSEKWCQTVAHMQLVRSLAIANPTALGNYGVALLRAGVDILHESASVGVWQRATSAVHLLQAVLQASDSSTLTSELEHTLDALSKYRHDKMPLIRKAVLDALKTAKMLLSNQPQKKLLISFPASPRNKSDEVLICTRYIDCSENNSAKPNLSSRRAKFSPRELSKDAYASDYFCAYFSEAKENVPTEGSGTGDHNSADIFLSKSRTDPLCESNLGAFEPKKQLPLYPISVSPFNLPPEAMCISDFKMNSNDTTRTDEALSESESDDDASVNVTREIVVMGSESALSDPYCFKITDKECKENCGRNNVESHNCLDRDESYAVNEEKMSENDLTVMGHNEPGISNNGEITSSTSISQEPHSWDSNCDQPLEDKTVMIGADIKDDDDEVLITDVDSEEDEDEDEILITDLNSEDVEDKTVITGIDSEKYELDIPDTDLNFEENDDKILNAKAEISKEVPDDDVRASLTLFNTLAHLARLDKKPSEEVSDLLMSQEQQASECSEQQAGVAIEWERIETSSEVRSMIENSAAEDNMEVSTAAGITGNSSTEPPADAEDLSFLQKSSIEETVTCESLTTTLMVSSKPETTLFNEEETKESNVVGPVILSDSLPSMEEDIKLLEPVKELEKKQRDSLSLPAMEEEIELQEGAEVLENKHRDRHRLPSTKEDIKLLEGVTVLEQKQRESDNFPSMKEGIILQEGMEVLEQKQKDRLSLIDEDVRLLEGAKFLENRQRDRFQTTEFAPYKGWPRRLWLLLYDQPACYVGLRLSGFLILPIIMVIAKHFAATDLHDHQFLAPT